jgi:polar amino acid transport system substrate-binding protein
MKKWFLLFSLLFGSTAFAAPEAINVLTEEWAPYNFTENGKISGYSTEVVEAILRKANLSYTINVLPWARAYTMAQKGPNSLLYTMGRLPEREQLFKWVGPIAPRQVWLFRLKSRSDIQVRTLADAKKYTIGVVQLDGITQYLERNGFKIGKHLATVSNEEQNQRKLLAGRVDLITGNEIAVAFQMKQMHLPFDKLEKVFRLVDENYWMGFSLNTPDSVVWRTQRALDLLKGEGLLTRIEARYLR